MEKMKIRRINQYLKLANQAHIKSEEAERNLRDVLVKDLGLNEDIGICFQGGDGFVLNDCDGNNFCIGLMVNSLEKGNYTGLEDYGI